MYTLYPHLHSTCYFKEYWNFRILLLFLTKSHRNRIRFSHLHHMSISFFLEILIRSLKPSYNQKLHFTSTTWGLHPIPLFSSDELSIPLNVKKSDQINIHSYKATIRVTLPLHNPFSLGTLWNPPPSFHGFIAQVGLQLVKNTPSDLAAPHGE